LTVEFGKYNCCGDWIWIL